MDIREVSTVLTVPTEIDGENKLLCNPVVLVTTSGKFLSGKIVDLTIITDTIENSLEMDLLFFPEKINLDCKVGEDFTIPYKELLKCNGRVRVSEEDFSSISKYAIANLFNVNMTFQCKELHLIAIYQGKKKLHLKDGVGVTVGYELGECN